MSYKNRKIAKSLIVEYMECYYNRKLRHASIGYQIPIDFDLNLTVIAYNTLSEMLKYKINLEHLLGCGESIIVYEF